MSASLPKQRPDEVLRAEMGKIVSHLCLEISFIRRKSNLSPNLTVGSFATWSEVPTEVKLALSWRPGGHAITVHEDYISEEWLKDSLGKELWVAKL